MSVARQIDSKHELGDFLTTAKLGNYNSHIRNQACESGGSISGSLEYQWLYHATPRVFLFAAPPPCLCYRVSRNLRA